MISFGPTEEQELIRQTVHEFAESGLAKRADLDAMAEHGVRCFLVGESLMRQTDVEAATRALVG